MQCTLQSSMQCNAQRIYVSLELRNVGLNPGIHLYGGRFQRCFPPPLSQHLSSCSAFSVTSSLEFTSRSWRVLTHRTIPRSYGAFNAEPTTAQVDDPAEINKRAQVAKRLERTARYFKRLGTVGFWGQLVCTVVSAVILAFSIIITGNATAPVTLYLATAGIVAAFLSVFWSFGYIRLAQRLRATSDDPTKIAEKIMFFKGVACGRSQLASAAMSFIAAPPRAQVVKNLKNGIVINLLGMGAALLGMLSTVGTLVAKALTSSAQPFLQGQAPGYSPVLALDVFLVQASANSLLSHFLGLVFSLELLRSVTFAQPPPDNVIPKAA